MKDKSFYTGLLEETSICAQCGYCKVDCPIYNVLGWESSSPRARMLIGRKAAEGKLLNAQDVERAFQCTLCGKCRDVCSTFIDTNEVWVNLREAIANKNQSPDNMHLLSSTVIENFNITGDEQENREMWIESMDSEEIRQRVGQKAEVLYFTGCSGALYPTVNNIPKSMVNIMEKAGIDYTLLGQEESCCGFPLIGAGEFAKGRHLIEKNVASFRELGVKQIVTSCPSCFHTLRDTYPMVLGEDLPFEILHASQFLNKLIEEKVIKLGELNEEVTYHDPCDLGRNSGVYEEPRSVINSIPGVKFIEMAKTGRDANCCGGGGNLEAIDPDLTAQIAKARLQEVQTTGAKTVVSSCQQCKRTLQGNARKNKIRVRVVDLTELVWKSMSSVED
ncbi:MAG TPA: (Fe-S)-binding protein [Syntrophomonadaceae bacterium]|nr:(Fe-S)-binding protein [Syntrophomonadaceae bacterium]